MIDRRIDSKRVDRKKIYWEMMDLYWIDRFWRENRSKNRRVEGGGDTIDLKRYGLNTPYI